jgi:Domain of unknown function (DUF4349)
MKSPIILLLVLSSFTLSCSRAGNQAPPSAAQSVSVVQSEAVAKEQTRTTKTYAARPEQVSLSDAVEADTTAEAAERKIIRNADITIEVLSTSEAQHRVTSIAETHGGFVVTSEAKQRQSADPAQRATDFKLVVRVPANQFGVALDEIKKLATNVPEEKATGQDVTEEFIDLEARIKTQKALEAQFLGIMRQANKVVDALEVQRQIAEVRTEIEQLEGRKRFIENRSSLATITVNIQAPKPVLVTTTTGFGHSLRQAVSESVEAASEIIVFFVRFAIVMLPVLLFVGLPAALVLRYVKRRAKRERLAEALATPASE